MDPFTALFVLGAGLVVGWILRGRAPFVSQESSLPVPPMVPRVASADQLLALMQGEIEESLTRLPEAPLPAELSASNLGLLTPLPELFNFTLTKLWLDAFQIPWLPGLLRDVREERYSISRPFADQSERDEAYAAAEIAAVRRFAKQSLIQELNQKGILLTRKLDEQEVLEALEAHKLQTQLVIELVLRSLPSEARQIALKWKEEIHGLGLEGTDYYALDQIRELWTRQLSKQFMELEGLRAWGFQVTPVSHQPKWPALMAVLSIGGIDSHHPFPITWFLLAEDYLSAREFQVVEHEINGTSVYARKRRVETALCCAAYSSSDRLLEGSMYTGWGETSVLLMLGSLLEIIASGHLPEPPKRPWMVDGRANWPKLEHSRSGSGGYLFEVGPAGLSLVEFSEREDNSDLSAQAISKRERIPPVNLNLSGYVERIRDSVVDVLASRLTDQIQERKRTATAFLQETIDEAAKGEIQLLQLRSDALRELDRELSREG